MYRNRHGGLAVSSGANRRAGLERLQQLSVEDAAELRECPARKPGQGVQSAAFIHIPKTAGTFVHDTLRTLLPAGGGGRWCTWGDDWDRPGGGADLPPTFANCGGGPPGEAHARLFAATRAAWGAACHGLTAHQDVEYFAAVGVDYRSALSVTALRHPVDRVLSGYFYSLKVDAPFLRGYEPRHEGDLSGLLRFVADDPIGSNNLQTQHLGGGRHCDWPGTAPPPPRERLLGAAMHNLARICVIVLAEFMDESLVQLAQAAGWPSERVLSTAAALAAAAGNATGVARSNATPKPAVPLEVRQAIAARNELDMRLYEFAVQLFLRRSLPAG